MHMDPIETSWEETDRIFRDSIAGKTTKESDPNQEVVKTIFLYFREKLKESIEPLCNEALNLLKEIEDLRSSFHFRAIVVDDKTDESVQEVAEQEVLPTDSEGIRFSLDLFEKENKSIISDILSGKQEIFYDLYENEFPAVVRYILKNSGTVEDARDIFQDALIILVENACHGKVDLESRKINSYIFGISIRLWYTQLRQIKSDRLFSTDMNYLLKNEAEIIRYEKPDSYGELVKEIEQLGPRCKELLHHFYYLNHDWQSIAQDLGYSSGSVARKQKYKCLEKIRDRMKNSQIDSGSQP